MDRATGKLGPLLDGLTLRFQTGKGREERRMNIQYALRICRDEMRRKQPHITRQTDEIHFFLAQGSDHYPVVGLTLESFRRNNLRRDSAYSRFFDPRCAFAITQNNRNFSIANSSGVNTIGQRFEIRAAS